MLRILQLLGYATSVEWFRVPFVYTCQSDFCVTSIFEYLNWIHTLLNIRYFSIILRIHAHTFVFLDHENFPVAQKCLGINDFSESSWRDRLETLLLIDNKYPRVTQERKIKDVFSKHKALLSTYRGESYKVQCTLLAIIITINSSLLLLLFLRATVLREKSPFSFPFYQTTPSTKKTTVASREILLSA